MKPALFVLLLFVALSSAVAESRDVGFQGYTKRLWEAQNGLPDQTIQAFAQTEDGSLWIGTKGGLLRFDGARFIIYNREIAPALRRVAYEFRDAPIDRTDGLKIVWPDRWVQARGSNTEPIVRVTAEAPTEADARALVLRTLECIKLA